MLWLGPPKYEYEKTAGCPARASTELNIGKCKREGMTTCPKHRGSRAVVSSTLKLSRTHDLMERIVLVGPRDEVSGKLVCADFMKDAQDKAEAIARAAGIWPVFANPPSHR